MNCTISSKINNLADTVAFDRGFIFMLYRNCKKCHFCLFLKLCNQQELRFILRRNDEGNN